MFLVSSPLLVALASPAVGVDLSPLRDGDLETAQIGELYGRLVTRILDAGYSVRATDEASVQLFVDRVGGRYEVTASANDVEHSFRTQAAPAAVELLELQHRALEALRLVADAGDTVAIEDDDGVDVVVEFDDSVDGHGVERLYGDIVDILVRGELVVVPGGRMADWRLCAGLNADGELQTYRVSGVADCDDAGEAVAGRLGLEEHVINIWAEQPLVGDESELTAEENSGSVSVAGRVPEPEGARGWRVGVGGGGVVRRGLAGKTAVDPELWLGLRGHGSHGFGAALSVAFVPSSATDLRVLDTHLLIGPAWANRLGLRTEISAALLGGAAMHRADYGGSAKSNRTHFSAGLAVGAAWRASEHLAFELAIAPGAATSGQRHLLRYSDDTKRVVWERYPLRFAATVRAYYVWGAK